jgi:hypothetical protein
MPVTENTLRRMNVRLQPNQHGVSVCCERPSALYESVRKSLLVEDITADDVLWVTQRKGGKPLVVKQAGDMQNFRQPVTLQEVVLPKGN